MEMKYTEAITELQIRFSDADMAGHVHNAVYLQYFEMGRIDFMRRFTPEDWDWKKFGLILARNEIDYKKPTVYGESLRVRTFVIKLGNRSIELGYEVYSGQEGTKEIKCSGKSIMVCYDYTKSCSISIPETWRNAMTSTV